MLNCYQYLAAFGHQRIRTCFKDGSLNSLRSTGFLIFKFDSPSKLVVLIKHTFSERFDLRHNKSAGKSSSSCTLIRSPTFIYHQRMSSSTPVQGKSRLRLAEVTAATVEQYCCGNYHCTYCSSKRMGCLLAVVNTRMIRKTTESHTCRVTLLQKSQSPLHTTRSWPKTVYS